MTPQPSTPSAAGQLLALCMQTGPDGARVYTDAEVAAFIPFLLIAFAPVVDAATLSPAARALVGGLAARLGLDGKDPGAAASALREHFTANPPNPAMLRDFERHFRDVLKALGPGAAASAFASFVGAAAPRPLSTIGEARPAGTVPASPFARFQVRPSTPKKES